MELKSKNMELGWSYPKRKKHLDDLFIKTTGKTQLEFFQGKNQEFQKHTVPISLPKYRIDNGRTYAAQAKYLASHDVPKDFFEKDHESDVVQREQHNILKQMIREKDLLDYFKTNDQGDALILSHDGYVINGNRRLCCWRELNTDEKNGQRFSHIEVIILPPADSKDIDELEAKLQVHRDIKADYTWTARALMLKNRQQSHGYTNADLASIFEMSKSDVEELMDMLSYAETYLESRDNVGQYDIVDRSEYAFRQLHKRRPKIKEEPYKDLFEKLSYCLIDKAEEGRLYEAIPELADHLDMVVKNIEDEFDIQPSELSQDVDLLGGNNFSSVSEIVDFIEDNQNHDRLREITLDVIEGERIKAKEKTQRNFVLSQVKKANTALLEAATALNVNTKKDGITPQIDSIESSLNTIKEWLGNEDRN